MIIAIHQPAYLPWLGYLEKIISSDVFVYLDTVQLEKNSYSFRNKIKTPQGSIWLTIPLKMKGHLDKKSKDILIDNSQQWQKKHLKNIFFNYKKAPYFDDLYPKIEKLYQKKYDLFSALVYQHLLFWLAELKITTKIIQSSCLEIEGEKSKLILNLCKYFKADKYHSGLLGKNYLDEIEFIKNNIVIEYQNYQHPIYKQLHGDFLANMAIVDFWMNTHNLSLISGLKQ